MVSSSNPDDHTIEYGESERQADRETGALTGDRGDCDSSSKRVDRASEPLSIPTPRPDKSETSWAVEKPRQEEQIGRSHGH